ncbi:MAG: hypothetical protein HQM10_20910 [Candidatus Riflebacteria bacterium]|nr:hypothetical protein [Candidatus Riflebacteria bacterium]
MNPEKCERCFLKAKDRRRGMSLFVVMAALTIISIMAFTSNWLAIQSMRRSKLLFDIMASYRIARSACACAIGKIQEGIETQGSAIYNTLMQKDLSVGTVINFDTAPLNDLISGYGNAAASVKAKIVWIEPLDQTMLGIETGGADTAERRMGIEIEAHSTCNLEEVTITEVREVKVVNLMPGILSKFTLFVKKPDSNADAYNLCANNVNGGFDTRIPPGDRNIPIIFKNGGELDAGFSDSGNPDDYKKRGYIYLGGSEVMLNIAAGNDSGYGENFLFCKIGDEPEIPGYYHPNPPGSFFDRPPAFGTVRHNQTLNTQPPFASSFAYWLKYVVSGYFTINDDPTPENMNKNNRFAILFPGEKQEIDTRMRSSVLRLFGNTSNRSPTLVLGTVNRRYVEEAGIVVEATQDPNNVRDGILSYVCQSTDMSTLPPLPTEIPSRGGEIPADTVIKFDPAQISWQNIFPSNSDYTNCMSRKVEEPYLRSHDFMYFKQAGTFEPTGSSFGNGDIAADYQYTFQLDFHPDLGRSDPFFKNGNFENLPDDFLEAKPVYRVKTFSEFAERFIQNNTGKLILDAPVMIQGKAGETITFPSDMTIEKGGLIVVENGNVKIQGIKKNNELDSYLTVSIAVMNGNIELDLSRGGVLPARLIALRGRIVNLTPGSQINIDGGIAVDEFPADTFKAGGVIAFNTYTDPSAKDWSYYYRAYASDIPTSLQGGW